MGSGIFSKGREKCKGWNSPTGIYLVVVCLWFGQHEFAYLVAEKNSAIACALRSKAFASHSFFANDEARTRVPGGVFLTALIFLWLLSLDQAKESNTQPLFFLVC